MIWELTWTLNLKWRKTLHLLLNKRMKTLILRRRQLRELPDRLALLTQVE